MSDYKKYINRLEGDLDAYKYLVQDNLELLKISVDLSVVYNELWERAFKFKGKDGYDELNSFVKKLSKAKDGYDKMYAKYKHATLAFNELRVHTLQLADAVKRYEAEDELFKKEL
jgi:hypothetical protein